MPAGTYRLDGDVTLPEPGPLRGARSCRRASRRFVLHDEFNLDTYVDAFGDEETAFRKAYQALLDYSDHESLDLCGRRIALSAPLDMQACDPTRTTFAHAPGDPQRPVPGARRRPPGTTRSSPAPASYAVASPLTLTGVANAAAIAVGSLVTGNGVGREVYVRGGERRRQQTMTLSAELYDAAGHAALHLPPVQVPARLLGLRRS